MEEGVAGDGVRGIGVAPPLDEAGGKGAVIGGDIFAVGVASVQLLQCQSEGRVARGIAELQVQTYRGGGGGGGEREAVIHES